MPLIAASTASSVSDDGAAGAPAGTPQLSSLLAGYTAPPPWMVAGVDYAVGVPAGTLLKDPATIAMVGVSVDTKNHTVTVTGSNVTLNGYDFGLAGGWGISIRGGATDTVIENSNFLVGSNNALPINASGAAGNLTVQYNTIDGSGGNQGSAAISALLTYNGSGTFIVKYNSFLNAAEDAIDCSGGTVAPLVEYNLFDNLGTSPGSHPDSVQFVSSTVTNWVDAFNTIYQPNPSGMEGVQLSGSNGGSQTNTTIENNVIVAKGPAIDMSYSITVVQDSGNIINGAVIDQNYIDYTGAYGPFYPPSGSNLTFSGNVNLSTGALIAAPKGTSTGSKPLAVPDSALTSENRAVTITVMANDTDSGGTLNPASVTVSSAAADGTTSVNATTGVITYVPATDFYGTDSFQYTVGDSQGDRSAPATVTVHVDSPPDAVADRAVTPENQAVRIAVLANDTDAIGTINPASVAVSTAAAHGITSVDTTTGVITYTPAAGYSGTDTFQYTVANTLGVASAPVSVSVSVSVSAIPPGSGYADGASGAPAGAPQLPMILNGYEVRPPWEVAGVDYAVGVPSGTTLKDPSTIAMAGVSVNTTNHTITVTGNNVTLDSYNFGLANGYEVIVQGTNDTIENSEFIVGSNQGSLGTVLDVTSSAGNFSLLDNEINGNNVAVTAQVGSTISIASSGTLTFKYNYFHNSGGDMIDVGNNAAPEVDIIQNNLFTNIGVNTQHSDTIQWYNANIGAGSDIGFNTIYENANLTNGMGGLVPGPGGSGSTMTGLMVNNDTIIQTAAYKNANFTMGFEADPGVLASNIVIHDLYIDPTGPLGYTGSPWFPTGYYGDNLGASAAMSNVINMVTGAPVTVPSATNKTPQGYYVYPDASGNSPALSDVYSVTASPASGTITFGQKITFSVHLDESFTVTGTPTLTLNDGGAATYSGGTGTNALTFSYTVASTDTTVSALAITGVNLPSGVTVRDAVGNSANFAGAVATFTGLGVSSDGNNTVTVTDTMLSAGTVTIYGVASGNNTISAAGDTAASEGATLIYGAGTGTDSFTGGFENDNVHVSAAAVSHDTLTGGSGRNALALTTAGTFSLGGVSGFGPIFLADGNNTVTVTDTTLSDGTVTIYDGASGNNTISAAGDTAASEGAILIYGAGAGTGTDSFTGGFENDDVYVSAAAVSHDTLTGGSGRNALALTTAGTFSLGGVSGFGPIFLADGNNTVTVTDTTLSDGTVTIYDGASGNNTISAAGDTAASEGATLIYGAGTGTDSFTGGFENDDVYVSAAAVSHDTLTGGSGRNALALTTAGTFSLGGVSGFGPIFLADGNNTVTVTDTTLSDGTVTIYDGASGNNTISAAGDTAASEGATLIYGAGTGTDSFTGGFENDDVYVSAAAVSHDTLTGGSGRNALALTTAGTFSLGGVSGFGPIFLADGNNTVTVTDTTLSDGTVTIYDGASGNNTISAAGDTAASEGATLIYGAGTGTDSFTGGFENDDVYVSAAAVSHDTLTGGSGRNALALTTAGTFSLGGVSGFGPIFLADGNNTVTVTDTTLSDGTVTIYDGASGNNTISAAGDTAASEGATLIYGAGTGTDSFTGGFENDTIYAGTGLGTYTGGSGIDSFVYQAASDSPFLAGSGGAANDLINDFLPATDTIDLRNLLLGQTTVLDKGVVSSFTDAATPGFYGTSGVAVEYAATGGAATAYIDANKNGSLESGDMMIKFSGVTAHSLTNTDFVM